MIRTDQRYDVQVDVLGTIVFMLTRHEERGPGAVLDERGRFLASASIFSSSGWLQWPVVDMYVHVFARLLRLAWPRLPVREPSADPLVLGHDVDHPAWPFYRTPTARLRAAVGAVIHRRDIGLAIRRARSLRWRERLSTADPWNTYGYLMDMSERAGLASTFFFLTRDSEVPAGSTYQITDGWCTGLMAEIAHRGHHVALHGSYNSFDDQSRLVDEWRRLERASTVAAASALRPAVRQHYLRWRPDVTWRAQAGAGLKMDETLGFADGLGYRAGTAEPSRRSISPPDAPSRCGSGRSM